MKSRKVQTRQVTNPNDFKLVKAFNAEMERIGRTDLKLGSFDHSKCPPSCPFRSEVRE